MSNHFPKSDDFRPTSLAPKKSETYDDWQPAPISIEEQPAKGSEELFVAEPSDTSTPAPQSQQTDGTEGLPATEAAPDETNTTDSPTDELAKPEFSPPMPDVESIQEEAYTAGVEQGRRQAEADFGSATSALTLVCDQLNTLRETILKNSKNEMIELVLALSEKIIRHSVTEQNQTIVDTVESAIHSAVKSSEFYIYLHPDDMHTIQERIQGYVSGLNGLENLIIKSDQTIERGGCKVESENCTVDATIASQFKVLQETLRKEG